MVDEFKPKTPPPIVVEEFSCLGLYAPGHVSLTSQVPIDGPKKKPQAVEALNVTSLVGKKLELVQQVERCWLDTVRLTSTHSLGSGAQLLDLHFSAVARGDRQRAVVDLLIACQLSRQVLEFTQVNKKVASLNLRVGDRSLTVISNYEL